jgi:hypothetical protein
LAYASIVLFSVFNDKRALGQTWGWAHSTDWNGAASIRQLTMDRAQQQLFVTGFYDLLKAPDVSRGMGS